MKVFFIADTHFGESNIIRYENRPFADVYEMDARLISRWNSAVGSEDVVYHLGDFSIEGRESEILSKLNGIKHLVKGNHDFKSNAQYREYGFEEVYDCPIIIDSFWILSHDPLYVNTNMPYANLFGHVHASPVIKDYSAQHFCVSAERIDYTPVGFDEIKKKISEAVKKT